MRLLPFPGGLWRDAVISWWTLDGCCCLLVGSGWKECEVNIADGHRNADEAQNKGDELCMHLAARMPQTSKSCNSLI